MPLRPRFSNPNENDPNFPQVCLRNMQKNSCPREAPVRDVWASWGEVLGGSWGGPGGALVRFGGRGPLRTWGHLGRPWGSWAVLWESGENPVGCPREVLGGLGRWWDIQRRCGGRLHHTEARPSGPVLSVPSGPARSPSGPVRSGLVRSGPYSPSGPLRSVPVRLVRSCPSSPSGPFRSSPARPVRSDPSGPARSVRSGPIRSGPSVRSGPVGSGPVWSGPVWSSLVWSGPVQSKIRNQKAEKYF